MSRRAAIGWALAAITLVIVQTRPIGYLAGWIAAWWRPLTGIAVMFSGLCLWEYLQEGERQ